MVAMVDCFGVESELWCFVVRSSFVLLIFWLFIISSL